VAESLLQIGQLAALAGVSIDTVRYYERQQLLERAPRSRGGYRLFTPEAIERIRFIKQAQDIGLVLDEIKALIPIGKTGLAECQNVRHLLDAKLKELDTRLAQMRTFRQKLAAYLAECEEALSRKDQDTCPVLFELLHSPSRTRSANNLHRKKKRKP